MRWSGTAENSSRPCHTAGRPSWRASRACSKPARRWRRRLAGRPKTVASHRGEHPHRLAVEDPADVLDHAGEIGAVVLLRGVAEMGREHDIVELAQRMSERQRL